MTREQPTIRRRRIVEQEPERVPVALRVDKNLWTELRKRSIDEKRHMFLILEDLIRGYLRKPPSKKG